MAQTSFKMGRMCRKCSCSCTTLWRKGKDGADLCNACGVREQRHGQAHPQHLTDQPHLWSGIKEATEVDLVTPEHLPRQDIQAASSLCFVMCVLARITNACNNFLLLCDNAAELCFALASHMELPVA